jgi:hypothetical protein
MILESFMYVEEFEMTSGSLGTGTTDVGVLTTEVSAGASAPGSFVRNR